MRMPRKLTEAEKAEMEAATVRFRERMDRLANRSLFWPK